MTNQVKYRGCSEWHKRDFVNDVVQKQKKEQKEEANKVLDIVGRVIVQVGLYYELEGREKLMTLSQ